MRGGLQQDHPQKPIDPARPPVPSALPLGYINMVSVGMHTCLDSPEGCWLCLPVVRGPGLSSPWPVAPNQVLQPGLQTPYVLVSVCLSTKRKAAWAAEQARGACATPDWVCREPGRTCIGRLRALPLWSAFCGFDRRCDCTAVWADHVLFVNGPSCPTTQSAS